MADSKKFMQIIQDDENKNLIILVNSDDKLLNYQIDMIENNNSIRLLTPQVTSKDNNIVLKYDLSNFTAAFDGVDKSENKFKLMLEGLIDINNIICNCERFLLFKDCLLLNKSFVFMENSTKSIFLIYIPIKRREKSINVYKNLILEIIRGFDFNESDFHIIQKLLDLLKRDEFSSNLFSNFLGRMLSSLDMNHENPNSMDNIQKGGNDDNQNDTIEKNLSNNKIKDKLTLNNQSNTMNEGSNDNFANSEQKSEIIKDRPEINYNTKKKQKSEAKNEIENETEENVFRENKIRKSKKVSIEDNLSKKVNQIKVKNEKEKLSDSEIDEDDDPTVSIERGYQFEKVKHIKISVLKLFIGIIIQNILLFGALYINKNKMYLKLFENDFLGSTQMLIFIAVSASISLWLILLLTSILYKSKNDIVMSKYDIWNIPNPGELDKLINNEEYREKLSEFVTVQVDEFYDYPYLESEYGGTYERIFITKPIFNIGKTFEKADYILNNDGIDDLHARIMKNDNGYYLIDFSKENDTFLNDKKLSGKEKMSIGNNDKIKFANVIFTFNI